VSKLGDYRFDPKTGQHAITVNGSLNPYAFLITYLHEVAHLEVQVQRGRKVPPHGTVWKHTFSALVGPMLHQTIFPRPLLHALEEHMKNPRASSQSDPRLAQALRAYDPVADDMVPLNEVGEGYVFQYHGRSYKKLSKRRTRVLCQDTGNGRRYLIPAIALVACCSG
jgi:hypothetical protein